MSVDKFYEKGDGGEKISNTPQGKRLLELLAKRNVSDKIPPQPDVTKIRNEKPHVLTQCCGPSCCGYVHVCDSYCGEFDPYCC